MLPDKRYGKAGDIEIQIPQVKDTKNLTVVSH
jgi:hypothetical protein